VCQFFLGFFCFIAFSGVSQRWEFKYTTKNFLQRQKIVSKGFCKKIDKRSKTDPPPWRFFDHVYGRLSVRGVKKNEKKKRKKKTNPVHFLPTRNQPTTSGFVGFFGECPLLGCIQHPGSRTQPPLSPQGALLKKTTKVAYICRSNKIHLPSGQKVAKQAIKSICHLGSSQKNVVFSLPSSAPRPPPPRPPAPPPPCLGVFARF
jgi:hypothetical protein